MSLVAKYRPAARHAILDRWHRDVAPFTPLAAFRTSQRYPRALASPIPLEGGNSRPLDHRWLSLGIGHTSALVIFWYKNLRLFWKLDEMWSFYMRELWWILNHKALRLQYPFVLDVRPIASQDYITGSNILHRSTAQPPLTATTLIHYSSQKVHRLP